MHNPLVGSDKKAIAQFKQKVNKQRFEGISKEPTADQLKWIYTLILNQKRLVYGAWDAFRYYIRCYSCRKESSLKKIPTARKDYFLNKGIGKLEQDLDITNILSMLKGYRILQQVLFTIDD